MSDVAPFGFEDIPVEEKPGRVRAVFDSVAPRYDIMNDLMSGGLHRLWKRDLVARLAPRAGEHIADIAGGTGDIAALLAARDAVPVLCDYSEAMVRTGRTDRINRGDSSVRCAVVGDACRLPFADNALDAVVISFGLRNLADIETGIAEMYRVLRYTGRWYCLEFSRPVLPGLDVLYHHYSFALLPRLGQMVAGEGGAYRYLVESIRRFPAQRELEDILRGVGFDQVGHHNLAGGICAIHWGWRT